LTSVSTFGYWIGYLSRGQRVYYNSDFTREHGIETQLVPTDFWPPHWIALKYNDFDGEVIEWSSVN
uniref:Cytochrome c oxidase subunit 1 n=1 Tax=Angiostrongylus cantonensis TaxID=6313 RepID=A0A158P815_ANGCA